MIKCCRARSAEAFATVLCTLLGAAVTLLGCRDDLKDIVVIDSRPMRGHAAPSCPVPEWTAIEWDSELEFGCTGGLPCPNLAAISRACANNIDREAANFEHSVARDAGREPRCDGIVIVENTALRSGPVYQSIRPPHWTLQIAYLSSEESQTWLLVRQEVGIVGGYGQATAPEIARKMCVLIRERTAPPQNRASNDP
jgi:hypothetical protein